MEKVSDRTTACGLPSDDRSILYDPATTVKSEYNTAAMEQRIDNLKLNQIRDE